MIKLRNFRKKDAKAVALLIIKTYRQFNRTEFTKKSAVQKYLDYYNPKKNSIEQLYKKFRRTTIFFVAVDNNKIVGMIRGNSSRIINLFVGAKQHKKGIGKILVHKFESESKKQKCKAIKTRASIYAVPFYQKIGYKKTTGVRNFHGLKVYPMKKVLL
jgi:predicted N-acetyltransferase YhbS